MALGERQPLEVARRVAERFGQALAPACERIELAGSIRRCKETVGDIEIVAIPRYREEEGPKPDLFNPPPLREVNLVWEAIEEMGSALCEPIKLAHTASDAFIQSVGLPVNERDPHWHRKRLKGEARYLKLWLPRSGFKVDLFLADSETWGYTFTIRTGAADFARALVTHHGRKGGRFEACRVYSRTGELLNTPEERDMFQACGVRYIAPPLRVDASSLEPIR